MATCASSPFDHAKADVILRSADGVEFRVFMLFLSLASPFFETLFGLPQAPDGAADQEMKDGLAVIAVSEDSKTLDSFLRFCYPSTLAEDPSLDNLTDVLSVLAVARKYSLDLIERKVCQALANPKVLGTEPFRCFAIARNARLKHETITAARQTLRQPLIPAWFVEIDLITASDLLALLTYHKNCGIAVQALMKDLKWITDHYGTQNSCNWLFGATYNRYGSRENCGCGLGTDTRFSLWSSAPVVWWAIYMQEVFELLVDQPSSDTVRTAADKTIENVRSRACATCSGQVKANMAEFSDLLGLKVEEAVAPVRALLYHGLILIILNRLS
ncbi:uncharacterized protein EDB91DRAFT_621351 [Suillus paluster]|uniref:uncharacterized protein n=1 Tax=Suillus paluster TaxID=48578 RepID=UPI001B87B606|nr:uncharacterized protein EDB91DRAFT_621351 [Suillus paluster]KAG1734090.1 hypothetical protein EDB91DRAFT_621351 [Suillus paluster]